jgi:hypothetical protein
MMVVLPIFFFNLLFHSWLAHFIAGLMLAELDVFGLLARYSKWKWSAAFNIFLTIFNIMVFFQSDYTLGRHSLSLLRSLQINTNDLKMGVDSPYWDENITVR